MRKRIFGGIGANILLLGIVSLLTDLSSEMMVSILPMYITSLGGTALIVGLTGGLGDTISSTVGWAVPTSPSPYSAAKPSGNATELPRPQSSS